MKPAIYTCVVASKRKKPDDIIKKYDINLEVEPYLKYKFNDAEKLRKTKIAVLEDYINNHTDNDDAYEELKDEYDLIKSQTPFEFYRDLVAGLKIDEHGDAYSTENPNGNYSWCKKAKFLRPFINLKGEEVYQAKKQEIDWNKMDKDPEKMKLYDVTWDLSHGDREPANEIESEIKENMSKMGNYLSNFQTKDDYINYNCSFWCPAFCDGKTWRDFENYDGTKEEWITNFFESFIEPLSDNDTLTLYEYSNGTE